MSEELISRDQYLLEWCGVVHDFTAGFPANFFSERVLINALIRV
jgi:hypothetical protein